MKTHFSSDAGSRRLYENCIIITILLSLFMMLFSVAPVFAADSEGSPTEISFNKSWKFNPGDAENAMDTSYDDSSWHLLNVPHDFSSEHDYTTDGEAESGFLTGGIGWYRKSF